VLAEKADRNQPMVVEADRKGDINLVNQALVLEGNAVVSQGSMLLRAERIEVRQTGDGYLVGSAAGGRARPASWRQKREGLDETVEGSAERIEFDGRADTLRLVGHATVRRLRAGQAADEITGAAIVWDNTNEVFKVEGGNPTPTNPTGRVRAVLSPRAASAAADPAPPAAPSALTPSRALGAAK
jgi:lipopolysaccharide export system protein LptA